MTTYTLERDILASNGRKIIQTWVHPCTCVG